MYFPSYTRFEFSKRTIESQLAWTDNTLSFINPASSQRRLLLADVHVWAFVKAFTSACRSPVALVNSYASPQLFEQGYLLYMGFYWGLL